MAEYRYRLFSWPSDEGGAWTETQIGELPFDNVSYDLVLNGAGRMDASLPLAARRSVGGTARIRSLTNPVNTRVYVERNGRLVWTGVCWVRSYDSTNKLLRVTYVSDWAYYRHLFITRNAFIKNVDQATIVIGLMRRFADVPRMAFDFPLTGQLRDRNWNGFEFKNLGEAIEQLSAVLNGFDFVIEPFVAQDGRPARVFRARNPRIGAEGLASRLHLKMPGNVLSYSDTEDGTVMATRVFAIGNGEGTVQTLSESRIALVDATRGILPAQAYPELQATGSFTDVKEQATLDGHAANIAREHIQPVRTFDVTARVGDQTPLLDWNVGDDANVNLVDQIWNPPPFTARCVAIKVDVGDGRQPELATFSLDPARTPLDPLVYGATGGRPTTIDLFADVVADAAGHRTKTTLTGTISDKLV